jgi:chemotaxis protein histidine kinase CheA
MSAPAGFLEFFILEAGDYVEQLDGVLLRGGVAGPDGDGLLRAARALRGTATMAKLPTFAEVAASIERVGRALQEGVLRWDPALGGALVAAVDDLKILLRGARNWSATEDQRASARAAELSKYAPVRPTTSAGVSAVPTSGHTPTSHLATEASNIAAGLELLATRAGDPETAANVLRRVRALRGIAGVKEIAPLADVLAATEDAARGLESNKEEMSPDARQLLEAAAAHLRTLASALRGDGGGDVNAPSSSRDAFNSALDAWANRSGERERVVPIAELFYGDGAPGIVEAAQNPPTSVADRFRLELVSLGEHLRQVIDAARRATDNASTVRARRDLRGALRALQAAASSFGETEVAALVGAHVDTAQHVDFLGLAALDDLAAVLAEPGAGGERLRGRLDEISGGRDLSSAIGAGFGSEQPAVATEVATEQSTLEHGSTPSLHDETPVNSQSAVAALDTRGHENENDHANENASSPRDAGETPAPPQSASTIASETTSPTPAASLLLQSDMAESLGHAEDHAHSSPDDMSANAALAMLDSSIAALESLDDTPFVPRTNIPEEEVVPIESLLYRGRAALMRAVEVRDDLKRAGTPHDQAALDELFDLVELARAEYSA